MERYSGRSGKASLGLILLVFAAGIAVGGVALQYLLGSGADSGSLPPTEDASALPALATTAGAGAVMTVPGGPASGLDDAQVPAPGPAAEPGDASDPSSARRNAVVRAAERAGPAVVSISVTQIRYVRGSPFAMGPSGFNQFFQRFFHGRVYGKEVSNLGSGVIIDARGIVVTNEHLVRQAKEIKVSLADGRTFDGSVVGADRTYDLAVLRIEGRDLPVAPVGDSDDLMVGEWAIALGNPFGFLLNDYQPTVTAGVISATDRDIKPEGDGDAIYKKMIQTDAAINPGNSGGPLVNGLGEVIGINTFIFTTGGGSLGMGFAIPINSVVRVVREILEYGRVRRIWIGIRVQEISRMVADYFDIRDRRGLLVWGIEDGSPGDRAGIRVGDIIRRVDGQDVSRATEAQRLIFGAAIGDLIVLSVEREGQTWNVEILLEEAPGD